MKDEPFYKLKLLAGLHKDAELFLEPDVAYTLGSSDECDIILLDTGVEKTHLRFRISKGKIYLDDTGTEIVIDGKLVPAGLCVLSNFQVIGMGGARLAIGPADEAWPSMTAKVVEEIPRMPLDLVPVNTGCYMPECIEPIGRFRQALLDFFEWLSLADKKVIVIAGIFLFVMAFFIIDTWRFRVLKTTTVSGSHIQAQGKSVLLSMVNGLKHVERKTLEGTGLCEPAIAIHTKPGETIGDPVDHIRHILKNSWGSNIAELQVKGRDIQFKGFDDEENQDLILNLEQSDNGEMTAKGITLTPKKKKAILSQMGDFMRVKLEVAEEMENVCKRVLEKKGVRGARANFSMEQNTFTLSGSSEDGNNIAAIGEIIAKAFPNTRIKNQVQLHPPEASKLSIAGVSTSGIPHVILKDGGKVFRGGKLNNGCIVTGIKNNHVELDCQGFKRSQEL